jgi:hypothetical protein
VDIYRKQSRSWHQLLDHVLASLHAKLVQPLAILGPSLMGFSQKKKKPDGLSSIELPGGEHVSFGSITWKYNLQRCATGDF